MSAITTVRDHLKARYADAANVVLADYKLGVIDDAGNSTIRAGRYVVMLQPVAAVPSPPPLGRAKPPRYLRETFLLHFLANTNQNTLDGALRGVLDFAENEVVHLVSQQLTGVLAIEFVGVDILPERTRNSVIVHAQARISVDTLVVPTGVVELRQRDYFATFPPTHVDVTGSDTYSAELT